MKKILIALFCLLLIQPAFAFGTNKKLNFANDNAESQASKILYEYVLKEQNMTPEEINDFAQIELQSTKAFEVDLNGDGTNEVIGVVYSTLYWGTAGYSLFILQKQYNEYINIAYVTNFEPQKYVYVLNTSTNGYKDIKFYGSSAYKFKPFIAKYSNGKYVNDIQTKSLEKVLFQNK